MNRRKGTAVIIGWIFLSSAPILFCAHATDYFVYFEEKHAGDYVGPEAYLVPRKFVDTLGTIRLDRYRAILSQLKTAKPKLYEGTSLDTTSMDAAIKGGEDNAPGFYEILKVKTSVKTEEAFRTIMREIVFSFADEINRRVVFSFSNPDLQKRYGGRSFTKADIAIPAFVLTYPEEEPIARAMPLTQKPADAPAPTAPSEEVNTPVTPRSQTAAEKPSRYNERQMLFLLNSSMALNGLLFLGFIWIFFKRLREGMR